MSRQHAATGTVVLYRADRNARRDHAVVRLADGPRAAKPAPHEWRRINAAPRSIKGAR